MSRCARARPSRWRSAAGAARRWPAADEDPNRFLAAVQVGVTLAGFLSAAFGAATLADKLGPDLGDCGLLRTGAATAVALIVVTLLISYVSLVLGELAPKRLALQRAEGIALFARAVRGPDGPAASRPVIWLLSTSTNLVVRLLGGDPERRPRADQRGGAARPGRRARVARRRGAAASSRTSSRPATGSCARSWCRAPRSTSSTRRRRSTRPSRRAGAARTRATRWSRGSHDDVVGFVHVRDLFDPDGRGALDAGRRARPRRAACCPAPSSVLPALSRDAPRRAPPGHRGRRVRRHRRHRHARGPRRGARRRHPRRVRRRRAPRRRGCAGGDVEVDGLLNLDDFEDETGLELPDGPYETVGGLSWPQLGRLPASARGRSTATARGEGVDGRRVARVQVTRVRLTPAGAQRVRRPVTSPGADQPERPSSRTGEVDRIGSPLAEWRHAPSRLPCYGPSTAAARALRHPADRRTRSTSATTWARCGSGWRCRRATTRSTASSTCTRSPSEHDPAELRQRTRVTAAQLLAAGLDPERCTLFVQSPRARARPARLGAGLHHRVRRGQPDDAVQGQVRQGRAPTARASGCSPTRSCRPPTSCSTRPTRCRSARTSASTWS